MTVKKNFRKFWRTFFHPRVFFFMFIGTLIIFLTFFTDNNALEIAISAMASVFIGIGVNNFSIIDARQNDRSELKPKINNAVKMMEISISKVRRLNSEKNEEYLKLNGEIAELEQILKLAIELMKEANRTE